MQIPSIIGGRYRVLRELGRGGMGAVYLVEHVHTGEQLALKLLLADGARQADAVERFKREARAPARIRSEHVVRITDADVAPELGGAPFMVMEALVGKDLDRLVTDTGKLPPSQVAWILGQIAVALDKAHAIGIVHRDLKPDNLFLHTREDGTQIVKILDFGISKIREKDPTGMTAAGLTQTGVVMGTPFYMAPEQARGQATNIGPATDVWALGLVTLRLLTAQTYWQAEALGDLLIQLIVEPMKPPSVRFPELGIDLDAWFARSCDRDPARRFASAGEQVRAFATIVNGTRWSAAEAAASAPAAVAASAPAAVAGGGASVADAPGAIRTAPIALPPTPAPSTDSRLHALQSTTGGAGGVLSRSVVRPQSKSPVAVVLAAVGGAALIAAGALLVPRLARRSDDAPRPAASASSAPPGASASAAAAVTAATATAELPPEPPPSAAPASATTASASASAAAITPSAAPGERGPRPAGAKVAASAVARPAAPPPRPSATPRATTPARYDPEAP